MHDAETRATTVPLNEEVWQAWLEKNRRKERAFNAKMLRLGGVVAGVLLALGLLLLVR